MCFLRSKFNRNTEAGQGAYKSHETPIRSTFIQKPACAGHAEHTRAPRAGRRTCEQRQLYIAVATSLH